MSGILAPNPITGSPITGNNVAGSQMTASNDLSVKPQNNASISGDDKVRELMERLPAAPVKMGTTTETVTKRTFTETSVKRVTKNEAKVEDVTLVKAGGPLGLSIIGGSDHSCVPFGTGDPGIFISKVRVFALSRPKFKTLFRAPCFRSGLRFLSLF